jgi:hypothetical protein
MAAVRSRGALRRRLGWTAVLLVALPAAAAAFQQRVILVVEAGTCTLRLEADDDSRTLRLRAAPESASCRVSREAAQQLLKDAFSRTEPPKLEGTYSSLYIGRLIGFPWLASYVASAAADDVRWDRRRGKPVAGGINAYVGALLSRREVTGPIESAIQGSGYRIGRATVEKVLVGGFRDVPGYEGPPSPGKVPFDAQVWFTLEKG